MYYYTHMYTHAYAHENTCECMTPSTRWNTDTNTHNLCTNMHTHTHTHVYKRIDVQIHTHIHVYIYIMSAHIHTYTYIHTRTQNVHMNARKARLKQRRGHDCAASPPWHQETLPFSLSSSRQRAVQTTSAYLHWCGADPTRLTYITLRLKREIEKFIARQPPMGEKDDWRTVLLDFVMGFQKRGFNLT